MEFAAHSILLHEYQLFRILIFHRTNVASQKDGHPILLQRVLNLCRSVAILADKDLWSDFQEGDL